MKKLLFSFCVLFSLSNISYAQGIELKEVEIKLESPQEFKKGEPIEIKPKTPLPVYGIVTGLCFAIGKPFPAGKTTEEQKKKALIKALIKGEKSGRIENFDPVAHLAKLHKKHL